MRSISSRPQPFRIYLESNNSSGASVWVAAGAKMDREYSAAIRSSCLYCVDMESRLEELHENRLWPSLGGHDGEIYEFVNVHYRLINSRHFGYHGCEVSHFDAHGEFVDRR